MPKGYFTIVSGGQTGADRGGLEAAIDMDVPHRGYCPKGRKAEDGVIPPQFKMSETSVSTYKLRTELNVADSCGTLIFTAGPLNGGSLLTYEFTTAAEKPVLWIDLTIAGDYWQVIIEFVAQNTIWDLNVAGNRESKAPGIQQRVRTIMAQVLVRLA